MGNKIEATVVEITFKRVQQFLFAVPRLKAMLGANACLGETIREKLVAQVQAHNFYPVDKVTEVPDKVEHDPIQDHDNPKDLYSKGIISRDGGHFTAVFKSENDANTFVASTKQLVAENLPDIQIEAKIHVDGKEPSSDSDNIQENSDFGESPQRLPQFTLCEDTGEIANIDRNLETPRYISEIVKHLEGIGDRFRIGSTTDVIGLLKSAGKLPGYDKADNIPKDLSELAGSKGYIAVIHADGNNIGKRRNDYVQEQDENEPSDTTFHFDKYLEKEVKNEKFFHAMRTAVRASVVQALECVFTEEVLSRHKKVPYQLLMLGGDDLLIITRPEYAFPFTISMADKLRDYPLPEPDSSPVSIGAGIIIAHHNIPFYHLYHLAENLAGSAKKLFRQQTEEHSVVDWMLSTNSWIDDIDSTRRLYDMNEKGTHITSAKPYFILDEAEVFTSLETLWTAASNTQQRIAENNNKSDEEKFPRSKLKELLHPVGKFKVEDSKDYYQSIKPPPDDTFQKALGKSEEIPWEKITVDGTEKYLTRYKDLMELIELHYLGRSNSGKSSQQEDSDTSEIVDKETGGSQK